MVHCVEVTPGGWFDKLILKVEGGWDEVMENVKHILEEQYSDGDKGWNQIEVNIRCVTLTEEEFAELETE